MLAPGFFGLGGLLAGLQVESQVFLRDARKTVRTDTEMMNWTDLTPAESDALKNQNWQFREADATAITWERFLLDLHAARFLGPLAKGFTDAMAVLILVLAASGIRLYRTKRNGNGNGKGL